MRRLVFAMIVGLVLTSCSADSTGTSTTQAPSTTAAPSATAPSTTVAAAQDDGPDPADVGAANEALAEAFIDAFYSFDPASLSALLTEAGDSAPFMLFYQGWAEGANYSVVERAPCESDDANLVVCPVTVQDDLATTLQYGFDVTDTFDLFILDGAIRRVGSESNDPPVIRDAFRWVFANNPDLADGACAGFFDGGPTPQECAQAMVAGMVEFVESEDFTGGTG